VFGKILQRYVLRELAGPTLLGLVVATFVLLATHLFRLIDLLVNRGVPTALFVRFVGTLLPPLLVLTVPMALLVGVLLGVGRLAADNEIMAMRTSGVNLLGVFAPVLFAGVALAGGLWVVAGSWVPSLVDLNSRLLEQIKFVVASHLEAGRVFHPETDTDVALYFRRRNPATNSMDDITLRIILKDSQTRREKNSVVISAHEGRIEPNPAARYMDVILTSGTLHHFDRDTTATGFRYVVSKFDTLQWRLFLEDKGKRRRRSGGKPRELTNSRIVQLLESGALDVEKKGALKAELNQRRSIPLACIAFVLLGVPLAIRVRPAGKAIAFSIAFGLIFFYYVMLKWGVSLSQTGSELGGFVIFLPNLVVGGIGTYLFYRVLRS